MLSGGRPDATAGVGRKKFVNIDECDKVALVLDFWQYQGLFLSPEPFSFWRVFTKMQNF